MHRRTFLSALAALIPLSITRRATFRGCEARSGWPANGASSIRITKRLGRIVLEDGTTYEDHGDGAGFIRVPYRQLNLSRCYKSNTPQ